MPIASRRTQIHSIEFGSRTAKKPDCQKLSTAKMLGPISTGLVDNYERAILVRPTFARAYIKLGDAYRESKRAA
jgi:hypothetical protein